MALVGFEPEVRISWLCGGSPISERFVLSAALCSEPEELGSVGNAVSYIDIRDKDGPDSAMRQQFQIIEHYVHKDYHSSMMYNDIILFRLDRDVEFTRFVAPACLYQGVAEPKGRAVVTGWDRNQSVQGQVLLHRLRVAPILLYHKGSRIHAITTSSHTCITQIITTMELMFALTPGDTLPTTADYSDVKLFYEGGGIQCSL
ncbi:serine-type endopeptidase activity protein [Homalodisca vitripennis]|nr:serine-type endopeptidase activity protein [Homalodisca vitripennis]